MIGKSDENSRPAAQIHLRGHECAGEDRDVATAPAPAVEEDGVSPPADLVAHPQWVIWRHVRKEDAKTGETRLARVPFDAKTGRPASSTDPATWSAYAEARVAAGRSDDRGGLGFVLAAEDPFTGIDLDGCVSAEGEIAPWALAIVERLNSYTELSPSGTGLHLFVRGTLPAPRNVCKLHGPRLGTEGKRPAIELYDRGRYFTVTSRHLAGTPATIEERSAALQALHEELFPEGPTADRRRPTAGTTQSGTASRLATGAADPLHIEAVGGRPSAVASPPPLADTAVVEAARRSRSGAKFDLLWDGRWEAAGPYGSQSEADLALCQLLAFFTGGDRVQMERLFRRSGLMRPKWDEPRGERTYGERTLDTALSGCRDVYTPPRRAPQGAADAKGVSHHGDTETRRKAHGERQDEAETAALSAQPFSVSSSVSPCLRGEKTAAPEEPAIDLDEIRQLLADRLGSAREDPGAVFAPDILAALAALRDHARADWVRARRELKKAGVPLKELDQALPPPRSRRERSTEGAPPPRTVGEMLADAAQPQLVIPEPFFVRASGTGQVVPDEDGEPQFQLFAHAPILIGGRLRDAAEGTEYLALTWRRPDGWREKIVDRGVALDPRKLIELASDGFPVAGDNAKIVAAYLHRLEAANFSRLPRARVSSHLGWQGRDGRDGFLWGRSYLPPDGGAMRRVDLDETAAPAWSDDAIAFRGLAAGDEQIAEGFHAGGSRDDWLRHVQEVAGFPKVLLGLYAAFVPPLLRLLGAPNFILDWANRTTTGKSTVARLAASVWGNPDEKAPHAALFAWDNTRVGAERLCALLTGLPLILDDTKRVKHPKEIAEVLYLVANGRGRGRGTPRGLARTRTWNTVLISNGEQPATSFTQDGGTRTRCLEVRGIPFLRDDEETRRRVDRLNLGLAAHYGHAGPAFVQWLLKHRDDAERWADAYRRAIEHYAQAASGVEGGRLAQYAAALTVAARLAHDALDLPWPYRAPLAELWADLVAEATDAAGEARALREVMSWAHAHRESFLGRHPCDGFGHPKAPPGGWSGVWEEGELWDAIAFYPTVLKEALARLGYEPEAILAGWHEQGWLDANKGRREKRVRIGDDRAYLIVIRRSGIEAAAA